MKKTLLFTVMLMVLLVSAGSAIGFSGSGSGAQTDPYIVSNAAQLQEMKNELFAWYQLANNIDASETKSWNSGAGFVPVGNPSHPFVGHLVGGGFTISNLYIYQVTIDYVGLFGMVSSNATIENTTLAEPNIIGRTYCGALAGWTGTSPANCGCVNGKITGSDYVGGLVGAVAADTLSNCNSLQVEIHAHDYVGGLAGQSGSLTNCTSSGIIQANSTVGGLVGAVNPWSNSTIANCNSTANVSATGASCGGLIGYTPSYSGVITNCYATGSVVGSDNVGGLCGINGNNISFSYATGNVESSGTVGGLVGVSLWDYYNVTIDKCYSTGNVISHGTGQSPAGGLIGDTQYGQASGGGLIDCYAFGNVLSNGSNVGGLIGRCGLPYASVQRCYSGADVVSGAQNVGGLIGNVNYVSTISQCYFTSDVNGVEGISMIGGLVGNMAWGTISQCYSVTDVNGFNDDVGGLVGYNNGTITNCYSQGDVNGYEYIGGFVGESGSSGNISMCYSTGHVTGTYNTGGFAASNSGVCNSNNYWNTQTSGWNISACGTGKTTDGMMHKSTYEPDWDFFAIWSIQEGQGYPFLGFYQPTCGDPWHPYPVGDLNHDCKVDFLDFAYMAEHWMECTDPSCQ